ncbi:SDR family NAD(P)-dependent oxidoreductase [Cerasicoccus frondis]|uniref:SDR family NAD(P)-dependent oxidoreductase n=1 Tax=Cerasicoccus frondis TaxID=490090 RepID=UPI0028529A53|nr:SDR family oxidoreductase [Cerasicoccus frondis]
MDLKLSNQVALVSASSSGIGLGIAQSLAAEGATVVVNGRTEASVEAGIEAILTEQPDAKLIALVANAATAEGCAHIIEALPEVDILVNNLGIFEAVGFFDETDADWQRFFETNIMSGVRLTRHYLKGMLERDQGRVIFISSESGISPAPEMAHYSATKTMQLGISRALAEMTKGTRVTVNSVLPGPTWTPGVAKFIKDVFPDLDQESAVKAFFEQNRPNSLIQRFIDPREIGNMVAYVSSPLASVTNGASIRVEGGLVSTAF